MGTTMTELTPAKLDEFIGYYHGLHDALIKRAEYNVAEAAIDLKLKVFWAGEAVLSRNGKYYIAQKTKI